MAESCGPDYNPHLRPLEQDSSAMILSICVYFSFPFSLSFSVCFGFFCLPLFCSQEVVWCDEGLTGPVVFYSATLQPSSGTRPHSWAIDQWVG